jgi:restriction endonuclease S subunit
LENGAIVGSLPSLRADFQTHHHYILERDDLLLSKTGAPFKAAVVADQNGADIVATSNMFIIKLKPKLANPYYVLAYLQSVEGLEQLASLSSGTSIPNLSLAKLKELRLPLRPMDEQRRFAAEYRNIQHSILQKKQELDSANKALAEFVNSINNK